MTGAAAGGPAGGCNSISAWSKNAECRDSEQIISGFYYAVVHILQKTKPLFVKYDD